MCVCVCVRAHVLLLLAEEGGKLELLLLRLGLFLEFVWGLVVVGWIGYWGVGC